MRHNEECSRGETRTRGPRDVFVRRLSPYYEHQLGMWIFSAGHLEREMDKRGLISVDACGISDPLSIQSSRPTARPVGTRREFLKTFRKIQEEGI